MLFRQPPQPVLNSDGSLAAFTWRDELHLLNIGDGARLAFRLPHRANRLAFAPDGSLFVVAGEERLSLFQGYQVCQLLATVKTPPLYRLALGQKRLQQIVDTNYWQSLTTVFLKDANFVATGKLMKEIRDYEREHLTPKGIKLGFAGDVALSQTRADTVAGYLARRGVARKKISAVGAGTDQPVGDSSTPSGQAKNRRIEITVTN